MTEQTTMRWTAGDPSRMGANEVKGGVNFAFAASPDAKVFLVLQNIRTLKKTARIPMKAEEPFGNVRSVMIPGLKAGKFLYYYEVDGVKTKDPYARLVRDHSCGMAGNAYDWENDRSPAIPVENLMIYKIHVRGFTKKAPSPVRHRGTFRGVAEASGYIRDLGPNAVLLMPCYEFDPTLRVQPFITIRDEEWRNYRNSREEGKDRGDGKNLDADELTPAEKEYSPSDAAASEDAFSKDSAAAAVSADGDPEILNTPKERAQADDVTAGIGIAASDSSQADLSASVKGTAPAGKDRRRELPKAHPLMNYWGYAEKNLYYAPKESYSSAKDSVREFREMVKTLHADGIEVLMEIYVPRDTDPGIVLGAVRKWKIEDHVDGFHFVGEGVPMLSLVKDPLLASTKMLFEHIDGGWVYGGDAPKKRNLLECSGNFEYTARRFLKSDEGQLGAFAAGIRRNPSEYAVVNYMADVNGFTLCDAVSYDWKHNEENGENNCDGSSDNYSWNCGAEGPTRKKNVKSLRLRQIKNALLYVFLSQGVPMLLAGDEGLNSQGGNNNAYASDNKTGWTEWKRTKDAANIREFTKKIIHFRKAHPIFHMAKELKGQDYRNYGFPDISFHDTKAWVCSFENANRTLAVLYNGRYTLEEGKPEDGYFLVAYNAYWDEHSFALPDLPKDYAWRVVINTAAEPGKEFAEEIPEDQKYFTAGARSCAVLTGVKEQGTKKRTRRVMTAG